MQFKRVSISELAPALPDPQAIASLLSQYAYLVEFVEDGASGFVGRQQRVGRYNQLTRVLQEFGLHELASEMDSRNSHQLFLVSSDMLSALCETRTAAKLRASTNWLNVHISSLSAWNHLQ